MKEQFDNIRDLIFNSKENHTNIFEGGVSDFSNYKNFFLNNNFVQNFITSLEKQLDQKQEIIWMLITKNNDQIKNCNGNREENHPERI